MIVRLIVQNFIWFGAMGILLFLAAGTFAWPGAWAYLVLMVALSFTLGIDLARHDPGLLRERMGSPVQRDQPAADKMLLIALLLFMFAWLVLMGLDAKRFAWSSVPAVMQVLGALITLWSIWFCYRAMRENSFAAPVIKLQQERGQRVISTGPYAFVRHPMYFGAAFYFIGTALLLGSWWGVIFASVLIGLLCIRIPIEEKALRAGLVGYDEYAAHVRYRLIPHVW
jgi:protein-S-isoprenylcysteine O-methyltransferase Ste14